ncbi:transposase [Methylobacterium aquaticum]|uniref:transposase n=1 Tax=Methylobacterium aquaticum TaxID=270351 RepID=UPI003CC9467D
MVDRHPRAAIRTQRSHEFAPQTRGNTNPTLCPNGRTRDGLRGAQQGRDCSVQTRSAREVGIRFGTVLSDACSGSSAAFRHAPGKRGLSWVVGILRRRKVDAVDLTLVPPPDRVRKLVPDQDPRTVEAVLENVLAACHVAPGHQGQAVRLLQGVSRR